MSRALDEALNRLANACSNYGQSKPPVAPQVPPLRFRGEVPTNPGLEANERRSAKPAETTAVEPANFRQRLPTSVTPVQNHHAEGGLITRVANWVRNRFTKMAQ